MGTTQTEAVPEPKYWHLKTVLSEALDSEFSVGEVLPNERELAARFGVARATLRQALEQLELEGRLQRRRGVGTTVAPPRVGVDVGPGQPGWPGAPDDLWQLEGSEEAAPLPAEISRLLRPHLGEGESLHAVRRSRMNHGQPVATEVLHVPGASVPGLPAMASSAGAAAHARAVLRELNRLTLEGQDRTVELGSARAEDARRLDRLPGAPVLVVATRYLSEGRVAAVSHATYRADTCRLSFSEAESLSLVG
ncbi:GntR family transcriptional regulator [Streptomyces xiaopingdaonensis]|uniref:GntR family transcriptional regulator n=1 Tax=Streptomyces xiaopingdaonensis TaxID=1565415 RepID=UPI00030C7E7D|nr:GntR family transcriptional regulator [Streptomyces xiaopingdaonensis]